MVPYLYRVTAQTRFPLRRQRSVTKKQRSMRVLARVLKEFLPVFSTAFECFWWTSGPMLSMCYDPKHFCHGRGRCNLLTLPCLFRMCDKSPIHSLSLSEKSAVALLDNLAGKGRLTKLPAHDPEDLIVLRQSFHLMTETAVP